MHHGLVRTFSFVKTREIWFVLGALLLLSVVANHGVAFSAEMALSARTTSTAPLDDWQWRSPLPQPNALCTIAYGNGTFVAMGVYNTVLTSRDGITWTQSSAEKGANIRAVIFARNVFVAVGNAIYTSPDGIKWKKRWSNNRVYFKAVAFGNETFVAMGSSCLTSSDGIKWTLRAAALSDIKCLVYGNGIFLAAGDRDIYTSFDGAVWTNQSTGKMVGTVAYGNGLFVTAYGPNVFTSKDGVSWNTVSLGSNLLPLSVSNIIFCNDLFIAQWGTWHDHGIITSADGITWSFEAVVSGFHSYPCAVAYGNNTFVAVGEEGSLPRSALNVPWRHCIYTSPDGFTWTERSYTVVGIEAVAYGNGTFVGVGPSGATSISPDGVTWESISPGISGIRALTYGNGTFVGVGWYGVTATSPDGVTWQKRSLVDTTACLDAVTYGNGTFVGVGNGVIITSRDGATWTAQSSEKYLTGVVYGNGAFVAVGDRCAILTSFDGATWTRISPVIEGIDFATVAYGNGIYTAVALVGERSVPYAFTSPDGITWSAHKMPRSDAIISQVTYGNNVFVAVGIDSDRPLLLTSSNGAGWTKRELPYHQASFPSMVGFSSVTYGKGTFVAAGSAMAQSNNTCTYVISPASAEFTGTKGNLPVTITASGTDCPAPSISASADWIAYSDYTFDGKKGSVQIGVLNNPTSSKRTGRVSVGPLSFPITQAGTACAVTSLAPSTASFAKDGGTGTLTVDVTPGDCRWTAQSQGASWIKITSESHGTGSGSVGYTVKANTTKKSRSGGIKVTLTKGGMKQASTVNQAY